MNSFQALPTTPRSRFTPDPQATMRLTGRDLDILAELFGNRLMTRDHLIALGYFATVSRANRTMRRLFDAGLVRRIYPRLGAFGAPVVYGIGAKAAPMIAERFGGDPADVAPLAHKDAGRMHVEHTLAVLDVRIALHQAARSMGWGLRWTPEGRARHAYRIDQRGRSSLRVLKPDAFFRLTTAFGTVSYFLEVDLGHVSRSQWQQTVAHYELHRQRGLVREAYGVEHCSVLTITSGGALRLRHLLEAAPRGCNRFLFTTTADIERDGVLGPIWRSRASSEPVPLLDQAHVHYAREEVR